VLWSLATYFFKRGTSTETENVKHKLIHPLTEQFTYRSISPTRVDPKVDPKIETHLAVMRVPPPSVIASWPPPNYIDPETRGPSLLIVNSVFLALSLAALAGRLWARLVILRAPGLDDILITVAIVSFFSRRVLQQQAYRSLSFLQLAWL
jgi:hypothetical protein